LNFREIVNLPKIMSHARKNPKIANVDFLETLRKDLCSGVIICKVFVEVF
jgi:hypothetical protein